MWAKFLFFLFLAAASAAVPLSDDLVICGFPALYDAVRERISPPCLFLAVNLIILTLWKLSEKAHHHSDKSSLLSPDLRFASLARPIEVPPLSQPEEAHAGFSTFTADHINSLPTPPSPGSHTGSSNHTAVSDARPPSPAPDAMEPTRLAVAGGGVADQGSGAGREDGAAGASRVAEADAAREVNRKISEAVDDDELDRRFEEFIRKVNEQILGEPCNGYVTRDNRRKLHSANELRG